MTPGAARPVEGTRLRHSGFVLARFPLLPIDELVRWCDRAGTGDAAEDPASSDRDLRRRLRELARRPEVQQALYLSSPSVHEAANEWLRGAETRRAEECVPALTRYVQRMAARPTPFGTMAGVTLGRVGARTSLWVGPLAAASTRSRVDMRFLERLAESWSADPRVISRARIRAADTAFLVGDRIHFVERRRSGEVVTHHTASIRATAAIVRVVEAARDGRTLVELSEVVRTAVPDTPEHVAAEFVLRLVDSRVLVAEVATPCVTRSPLEEVLAVARRCGPGDAPSRLEDARDALAAIDRRGIGAAPEAYSAVASSLAPLGDVPPRFHVDVLRSGRVEVSERLVGQVADVVEVTRRCFPLAANDPLATFREAFAERWQDREVELLRALDAEVGVGFGAGEEPMAPSFVERAPTASIERPAVLRPHELWLLGKVGVLDRAEDLVIDERAVRELAGRTSPLPLPTSIAAAIRIVGAPEQVDDDETPVHLMAWSGPSASRLLGRFSDLDSTLEQEVRRHVEEDDARFGDAIVAEVDYAPAGPIANVVVRPPLRRHRIPVLSSAAAGADVIPLSDLLVSVRGNRVLLRSRRLGSEVLPRISTAHRHSSPRQPPLYRFLGAVGEQGASPGWQWSWGALEVLPRLPRVRHGRFILAPRQWRFGRDVLDGHVDDREMSRAVRAWRAAAGAPRWVCLKEGDQELPIDLDNPLSVTAFARVARTRGDAVITEMLQQPGRAPARAEAGCHAAEVLIPFVAHGHTEALPVVPAITSTARAHRPGGAWVYAKLYAGPATLDHVLVERLAPAVEAMVRGGVCDRWFFIRYRDPHPHLRLRLRLDGGARQREVHGLVLDRLRAVADGAGDLLGRLVVDTYEPELERYGGEVGMDLAERMFHVDSEVVIATLRALGVHRSDPELRYLVGMRGVLQLLELCLGTDATLAAVQRIREGYAAEQRLSTVEGRRALAGSYRRLRPVVAAIVEGQLREPRFAAATEAVALGRVRMEPLASELRATFSRGEIAVDPERFATSIAHMHASRVLRGSLRRQEAFMYDMLSRALISRRYVLTESSKKA